MIKLCLSDMDNTLIPFGAGRASQRTIDAIHNLQEQGVDFAPASGRDRGELQAFFGGDASCYNMGVLVNGQKIYYLGEIVSEKVLDREALIKAFRIAVDFGRTACITYRGDAFGDWVGVPEDELGVMYQQVFMRGGEYHGTHADQMPDYPCCKAGIVVLGDDDRAVELGARLQAAVPELEFLNTVTQWFDITPRGWSKVKGVEKLEQVLGLTPEEVCVFGDSDNDLTMLAHTPNSCAVANANEAAAATARWHIPASADDGVAWALDQIADAARHYWETGEDVPPAFMRG